MRPSKGWMFLVSLGVVFTSSLMVQGRPPIREKIFLNQVITNGRAEIKYSELAEKQASSLKVKAFAARLIVEHKKFGEKLEEAARNMGITVSKELDRDQAGTLDGLSKLSGAEFDRTYLSRIVQDHERAVRAFETEAEKGNSEEVKKLCNDALPRLQRHLKRARELADEMKSK
jgi:putative membrane protein